MKRASHPETVGSGRCRCENAYTDTSAVVDDITIGMAVPLMHAPPSPRRFVDSPSPHCPTSAHTPLCEQRPPSCALIGGVECLFAFFALICFLLLYAFVFLPRWSDVRVWICCVVCRSRVLKAASLTLFFSYVCFACGECSRASAYAWWLSVAPDQVVEMGGGTSARVCMGVFAARSR